MKSKVIFMCGSHRRHLYIAERLWKEGRLVALIVEEREEFVPEPPANLRERDRKNFVHHFAERDRAERKFFEHVEKEKLLGSVPVYYVTKENLNDEATIQFIKEHPAEMLLTYGVHKVDNEIIQCHPGKSFNIHGGLSPWYRGNTTLFWPFYFLKPNWAGMTLHQLTEKLDGGSILHHSVPTLEHGDTMHEVACKAVCQVAEDLCLILQRVDEGEELTCKRQKSSGKLFVSEDWTPQTLRIIYELFDDKIVDMFLDGELENSEPDLVKFI